jgi:twitching motility protein PilU
MKEAMEKSTNLGMQTFDQALFDLYRENRISLEEALRNADSANNLRLRVKLSEEGESAFDRPLGESQYPPEENRANVSSGELKMGEEM